VNRPPFIKTTNHHEKSEKTIKRRIENNSGRYSNLRTMDADMPMQTGISQM
jgi:hypothetical protein